ncbi:Nop14-like protein [Laetiporus sulphureus 93-53]|uniref:Nop14-like protein n=1 Tax=Laetiporus sulphureus 93-53 TaxID=1314785 RepID=A0A165DT41_9APHY|nr:Nop14-like protein [Laetiporus sulphureus 93-53]KZT05576.1 Nop14-like protein [Laetiporus sulphureus 93-53]
MAKGSQLSQLKAAINQAGLSRPQQNGKKRKRTAPDQKDKEKKAAKLQEIHQKLNPFDVKVTKLKHDVGGRRIIGTTGRPAKSKQAGIEQRKKTLLKEYEERNHAGGIVDRRFGENDPTMTPEERMLERFTREHQRASKSSAFNLEDEDELTHYGQNLSKLDDFDNMGLVLDDDEDEGQIDRQTVQKAHFGGFEEEEAEEDDQDEPARKKTKAEVMAEVIAKSKMHKIQRQAQQEEDESLRHELDQELDSIRSLLYAPDPSASKAVLADESGDVAPAKAVAEPSEQDQEYDQYVRELVFEKRAKPKDRTKTEEEIALEEKEALEKAERKRVRRMNGEPEDSEDEEEGTTKRKRRKGVGDDLEDDFYEEDGLGGLGTGLAESAEVDMSEEGEEAEEDDGSEDGSEDEDEEDEREIVDDEEEEEVEEGDEASDGSDIEGEEGEPEALVSTDKQRTAKPTSSSTKELPFTFPCPTTHEEFLEIVDGIDDNDVPTVVQRIRTLHHPSLAEDNKVKLQGLTGVLIDHILYITSPPTPRFTLLTALMPHLFALTKAYPIQSAEHFIAKLNLMHKNLQRGLSRGATEPDTKTWPGLPELSLLRVIGQVWSTSDKNHNVVSPARLLMGAYLGLGRIRSLQDLASGLYLCSLFLDYESLSKRFVPEAINLLANAVLHLAPHRFKDKSLIPGQFPCVDYGSEHCASLTIDVRKAKGATMGKPNLSALLNGTTSDEQSKVDLLGLTLELIGRFADMYKSLDGFIELYDPIKELLDGVRSRDLPEDVLKRSTALRDTLGRLLKFSREARRPLMLQAHKPIPIPTYIPKFEQSSSNYLRNHDPDHERDGAAKLRRQYKQEKKGAIRELRKDARFLAAEQQRQQKEKDRAYNERMKQVFGSLESERAEEKAMEREKMKEKKRAGRK